jgi:hypothetical protein
MIDRRRSGAAGRARPDRSRPPHHPAANRRGASRNVPPLSRLTGWDAESMPPPATRAIAIDAQEHRAGSCWPGSETMSLCRTIHLSGSAVASARYTSSRDNPCCRAVKVQHRRNVVCGGLPWALSCNQVSVRPVAERILRSSISLRRSRTEAARACATTTRSMLRGGCGCPGFSAPGVTSRSRGRHR